MKAIYLLGGPGVGKSTVMRQLLTGWEPGEYERFTHREMFGHYMTHPQLGTGAHLGRIRDIYGGTDALARSSMPFALVWLAEMPPVDWVLGEGTRLGRAKFLWPLHLQAQLVVGHLVCPPEVSAQRRAERPGKPVPEGSFTKANTTQAANAARACEEAGIKVVHWDTRQPAGDVAEALMNELA